MFKFGPHDDNGRQKYTYSQFQLRFGLFNNGDIHYVDEYDCENDFGRWYLNRHETWMPYAFGLMFQDFILHSGVWDDDTFQNMCLDEVESFRENLLDIYKEDFLTMSREEFRDNYDERDLKTMEFLHQILQGNLETDMPIGYRFSIKRKELEVELLIGPDAYAREWMGEMDSDGIFYSKSNGDRWPWLEGGQCESIDMGYPVDEWDTIDEIPDRIKYYTLGRFLFEQMFDDIHSGYKFLDDLPEEAFRTPNGVWKTDEELLCWLIENNHKVWDDYNDTPGDEVARVWLELHKSR